MNSSHTASNPSNEICRPVGHYWDYSFVIHLVHHGPLTRYAKWRVAHAPWMTGTFPPPPTSKETASKRSRHASRNVRHPRAVMHAGIANPRWRRKRSRRMRNPQYCVSGKRPIVMTDVLSWCPTSEMASPVSLQKANDALAPQNRYQQAQYCLQSYVSPSKCVCK